MNVVFLPATESGNLNYGITPKEIPEFPTAKFFKIKFPTLVWYNKKVCTEAINQIKELGVDNIVLIGFSKSGNGAWNITKRIPELISSTVIFDAPVSRKILPDWGTSPFYQNDEQWQQDLPHLNTDAFIESLDPNHKLTLISGKGFHDEMQTLSQTLKHKQHAHTFISTPQQKHHWNSGWIEEAMHTVFQ